MDNLNSVELLSKDEQYIEKCNEYMKYIETHKNSVVYAFAKYFKDKMDYVFDNFSVDQNKRLVELCQEQIKNHDMSKYSDAEFYAYRLNFYPTNMEKDKMANDEEFSSLCQTSIDDAFVHHVKYNSHHQDFYHYNHISADPDYFRVVSYTPYPEYNKDEKDMCVCDIIEMICDWISMSIFVRKSDSYIEWFTSNQSIDEREAMSTNTLMVVEKITAKLFPEEYEASDSKIWLLKNKE